VGCCVSYSARVWERERGRKQQLGPLLCKGAVTGRRRGREEKGVRKTGRGEEDRARGEDCRVVAEATIAAAAAMILAAVQVKAIQVTKANKTLHKTSTNK
jgi:hypothetical protein